MDRSGWQLTNLDGSYCDCVGGQRAEVMYLHDSESTAAWIKVESEAARQKGFESLLARGQSMNRTDQRTLILCTAPPLRSLALICKRLAAHGRRC